MMSMMSTVSANEDDETSGYAAYWVDDNGVDELSGYLSGDDEMGWVLETRQDGTGTWLGHYLSLDQAKAAIDKHHADFHARVMADIA
jgi:hypothetical protein